ncbi:iron complex outermembrane recepter protein [Pseudomonas kuykendallii]|uniref:Iron complex outermembrane recepter protein n=1 Tax=Pseudomonas kuykendallii TaxID=1007099 RepID=A0A1H3E0Z5_9PSED|nr:iron complex outermembrane recepter protein [Pseudomonas kuykendallii]
MRALLPPMIAVVPLHPSLPFSFALLALATTHPAAAEDLFADGESVPQILTATRLKQSPAAVPGSVTLLDRQLIESSGARSVPELMRLVPGMMVGYLSGNQGMVNYHGSSVSEARRMQVLIDGRSVYRAGLATVDWADIPVALEDIDRIEVFRGPNTVSYGANALMGVINIITRSPSESIGTRLKVTRGKRGVNDWYASQGFNWQDGDMRLSLSGLRDDGFDHDDEGNDFRDSTRANRFNLSTTHRLDAQQTLDWQLAAKEGTNQRPYNYEPVFDRLIPGGIAPGDNNSDVVARDYAGSMRWTFDMNPRHSLYVQGAAQHWDRNQEWVACDAALAFSPQLAELWSLNPVLTKRVFRLRPLPAGTTPREAELAQQVLQQMQEQVTTQQPAVCGDVNQNIRETRYDLELQDTYSVTDSLRLLSGAGYRREEVASETYFGGKLNNDILRTFAHLEWTIDPHWILQGGAMLENDRNSGESLTPRLAVNYLITPSHGLRAVYSEAVRTPDMAENNLDLRYEVSNLSPSVNGQNSAYYFSRVTGTGGLKEEHMRSRELGYNGLFSNLGLSIDLKLFREDVSDMISEAFTSDGYTPSNANSMSFQGAELQADWRLSASDRVRLTYAYVDQTATEDRDLRLSARNSGSAAWMREWAHGWSSSVIYYGADALNERRFERLDLRLAKRVRLGSANLQIAGVLQQRLDDEALTWKENLYDDRQQFYLSAELGF